MKPEPNEDGFKCFKCGENYPDCTCDSEKPEPLKSKRMPYIVKKNGQMEIIAHVFKEEDVKSAVEFLQREIRKQFIASHMLEEEDIDLDTLECSIFYVIDEAFPDVKEDKK